MRSLLVRRLALVVSTATLAGGCATTARPGQTSSATVNEATAQRPTWLQEISPDRLRATVEKLASFGTRHTLSDAQSPTRGIGAARSWIESEFQSAAQASGRNGDDAMQVSIDLFTQPGNSPRAAGTDVLVGNVIAVLPGSMPEARARRYYVIGHYDSRATDVMDVTSDAPGANDDASGTALVMELARVMSKQKFDSTIVFLATAGEEQGLWGSTHEAKRAKEQGFEVRGVLNNDIVGDPTALDGTAQRDTIRVFSEGIPENLSPAELQKVRRFSAESDSPSRQLARYVKEVARREGTEVQPTLVFRQDRFLRSGDHVPFNEGGFAAIRFTVPTEHFDRQHQNLTEVNGQPYGDMPRFVDGEYLAGVARLNAAVLASLANAPSAPENARIITAELENGTSLRWTKSPEPDVRGYQVVWRRTTEALWSHAQDAGNVTDFHLPVSKDDFVFGVRAYDADGNQSPVSFCFAARE